MSAHAFNRLIDHTLLKPDRSEIELAQLLADARTWNFAAVCVLPVDVAQTRAALLGTDVAVATVIGFPLGANLTHIKVHETELALSEGATEFDMVIHLPALKNGQLDTVSADIAAVVKAAHGHIVKVIIETCLLTRDEIVTASKRVEDAGAHFVKTSTGFSKSGATVEDVALIRASIGPHMKIKASGGIRDLATLQRMIDAGANRIGTSCGVALMRAAAGS